MAYRFEYEDDYVKVTTLKDNSGTEMKVKKLEGKGSPTLTGLILKYLGRIDELNHLRENLFPEVAGGDVRKVIEGIIRDSREMLDKIDRHEILW